MLVYLYSFSMLVSAVLSFIYRKNLSGRGLIILIPYLFLTLIQEIVLEINEHYVFIDSTNIIYNIYRLITALVFFWIYFNIPFMSSWRKLMLALIIAYLSWVIITFCTKSINTGTGYLSIARSLVVTLFAVFFLLSYFKLDNSEYEKYWTPLVWITGGAAIFYSVVTASLAFQDYLAAKNATLSGQKLYQLIPQIMSILMYSCFSYAFYLCRKIK